MNSYSLRSIVLSITLAISLGSSTVHSADIMLHEHATLSGPIVRLGDISDISAASTSILKNLASTPLVPAPAPGSSQFLQRSHVRDLLASRGIDVQNLRILGAAVVEIGKVSVRSKASEETKPPVRTKLEIKSLLLEAIKLYLQDQTGHDKWRVTLKNAGISSLDAAPLGTDLTVEGGRAPWTGIQRFRVYGDDPDKAFIAHATVVKIQSILFSRQSIKKGDVIRASDVEIRQHEGRVPTNALNNLDEVVGMEAARSIRANGILLENQVRAPLQVLRGETVTVFARTGGISVRTFVVARQDGAMGDLVQVQTLDGKQRFSARVSGLRRLEVLAAGVQAGDYATLERRTQQR